MNAILFQSYLLAITVEKIHVSHCFCICGAQQISSKVQVNSIMQAVPCLQLEQTCPKFPV